MLLPILLAAATGAGVPAPTAAEVRAVDEALVACGTRHTLSSWTDPKRGIGCARDLIVKRFEAAAARDPKARVVVDKFEATSPRTKDVPAPLESVYLVLEGQDPERAKTANARRDAAVSVVILSDEWNGPWVQIDGDAEVLDIPESVEPLVEYFRNISGEHPDWAEYREAMVKQGKSLIRVTPRRWSPVATGGFPARLAD